MKARGDIIPREVLKVGGKQTYSWIYIWETEWSCKGGKLVSANASMSEYTRPFPEARSWEKEKWMRMLAIVWVGYKGKLAGFKK